MILDRIDKIWRHPHPGPPERLRRAQGVLCAAIIASGFAAVAAGPVAAQAPVNDLGAGLYLRDCAVCHAASGEGTARGPSLMDVGGASAHFMLSTGRMPIDEPKTELRRGPPAYSQNEIDAIVSFVAELGDGPDVPDVAPADGDLVLGEELYRVQCAACHGPSGIGTAITQGRRVPSIHDATPLQVAESMLTGPGPMPRFVPEPFGDHEVNSIARYVSFLQDPPNHGGHGLFNIGPVFEGLVGWVVVVPLLIALLLILGTKHER